MTDYEGGTREAFIRYPGSKAKLWRHVQAAMPDEAGSGALFAARLACYVEPFFGSGAIGWQVMRSLSRGVTRVVVNDIDPGMAALWLAVRDCPEELVRHVTRFRPSAEAFYEFRDRDGGSDTDIVVRAFEKLALHQISFSGLGVMAGGPLGGRKGKSEYNVDCRWNPARITASIRRSHRAMKRARSFEVYNEDFAATLARIPNSPTTFAYLDPPYVVQGAALYRHAMSDADHARLAGILRRASYRWLLSYDDCELVRDLYSGWATIAEFDMVPTIQTATKPTRRKNRELLISGRNSQ